MTNGTRIVLAARPHGEPKDSDFRFEDFDLAEPGPGEVALETLYLSLDPYMRGRMSAAKSYAAPVEIGDTMVGATVSRVLTSTVDDFAPGDVVLGYAGWRTHSIEQAKYLRKLDPEAISPSTALGVLGMPGFTAYAGLLTIGKPQPGETVVVAAAAGPVGSAVGQIAKLKGARAVGIAGGPDKVAYLKDELGFDRLHYDDTIGKLSLVGSGMRSNPGISATLFQALADAGINIEMISTSEIRVSVVTSSDELDEAVRLVHTAFGLDADGEAVVYAGTGR